MSLYKTKISGGVLQVPVLLLKVVKTDFIIHCLLLSKFISQYSYVLRHYGNLSYPVSFHSTFYPFPSPFPTSASDIHHPNPPQCLCPDSGQNYVVSVLTKLGLKYITKLFTDHLSINSFLVRLSVENF